MRWGSVRGRLTLLNVCVLAMILIAFALTLHFLVRRNLTASIDQELERRYVWEKGFQDEGFRMEALFLRMAAEHRSRPPRRPTRGAAAGQRGDGRGAGARAAEGGKARTERGQPRRQEGPPPPWLALEAEKRDIRETAWARQPFLQPGIFNPDGHPRHPLSVPTPWNQDAFRHSVLGQTVRMDTEVKGARVRLLSTPVLFRGRVRAIIQMVRPLNELERMMGNLDRTLLALMLPALLVAGGAAAFLTGRSLRPVKQLAQATAELSSHDLAYRLPLTGHDEFTELSRRFNDMAERLEGAFAQMEAANADLKAAYERQRQFTADASHELRTPLTRVKTTASVALASDRSPESYRRALSAVNEASDAMTRLIDDLLLLARSDAGHIRMGSEPADLKQALSVATELERQALGGRLRWELAGEELEVAAAEDHLIRLFGNLLGNAARHTPPEGTITLSACRRNGSVVVQVRDTGEGIPEEHLPHVCERFYRVDAARTRELGGTGLGLAICQSIVTAYGGEMTLRSEVGQGTTVSVSLPAALGETHAPPAAA